MSGCFTATPEDLLEVTPRQMGAKTKRLRDKKAPSFVVVELPNLFSSLNIPCLK